jgi:ABC-type antimicrobial peptide transport system permease subunit
MAIGAQSGDVAALIARQTFAMTVTGIVAGLGAAVLAGPAIRSLLYGISPQDPTALAAAAIFVVLIAIVATIGPTMDAVQVQPAEALRMEE